MRLWGNAIRGKLEDMNTTQNNSQPTFRTRLAAFAVVLLIGFVMGLLNGRGGNTDTAASGIVAQQQTQAAEPADRDADEEQPDTATPTADSSSEDTAEQVETVAPTRGPTVEEDGWYTTKDEVALYIHTYRHLPGNFISKTKARNRGWVASEGNLDEVCPGMSIGGSRYYNDEGQLPDKSGRQWTECDINYHGGRRGAERIVFSNDGLVFYTADHYQTFEQLY